MEATIPIGADGVGTSQPPGALGELIGLLRERVQTGALADTVYGPSRTVGDRTLIPVARVTYGFGLGAGGGPAAAGAPPAGGSGLGAGVHAVPVALVEVTPTGTRIIPIVDVARIALRGMILAGCLAMVGMLLGRAAPSGASEPRPRPPRWLRLRRR